MKEHLSTFSLEGRLESLDPKDPSSLEKAVEIINTQITKLQEQINILENRQVINREIRIQQQYEQIEILNNRIKRIRQAISTPMCSHSGTTRLTFTPSISLPAETPEIVRDMKMTMLDCSPKSAIPGALPKALSMDTVPALDLRPPILYPLHTLFSPDSDTWPSQHLAGQIERYFGDPAVTAFLNLPWYKGEALLGDREHDTEAELKSKAALPNMVTYLIFVNDGMRRFNTLNPQRPWGTIAGHITVKAINIEDMSAEIGLVITKEYQRTGLVYDVRSAILKYLYDLGFERIISRIMPENKKALQMVRHFAGNEGEEIFDEKGNKWIQLTVTRERMEQLMRLTEWDYPPKS